MDQIMRSALGQRLAESFKATYSPLTNVSGLTSDDPLERIKSGLMAGSTPVRALLDTLGLIREGGAGVASTVGDLAMIAGANIDQNHLLGQGATPGSAYDQGEKNILAADQARPLSIPDILAHGWNNSAVNAARTGPDSGIAYLGGATETLADPLNYIGGGEVNAASKAGRIAERFGLDLNSVNALLNPDQAVANHIIGGISSKVGERLAALRNLPDDVQIAERIGQDGNKALPLVPEMQDYNASAKAVGLPVLTRDAAYAKTPLVDNSYDIFDAARNLPGVKPTSLLDLPSSVEKPGDYNIAALASNLPALKRLEAESSSLAPDSFNPFMAARRLARENPGNVQREATPLPSDVLSKPVDTLPTLRDQLPVASAPAVDLLGGGKAPRGRGAVKATSPYQQLGFDTPAADIEAGMRAGQDPVIQARLGDAPPVIPAQLQNIISAQLPPEAVARLPKEAAPILDSTGILDQMDKLTGRDAAQNLASLLQQYPDAGRANVLRRLTGGTTDPNNARRTVGGVASMDASGRLIANGEDVTRGVLEYLTAKQGGASDDALAAIRSRIVTPEEQRLTGLAGDAAQSELETIKDSPYYAAFDYLNPNGSIKAINTKTGRQVNQRQTGGRFKTVEDVAAGNQYDDLAATIQQNFYGDNYNPATAENGDEFMANAQQAYQRYKALLSGETPPVLGQATNPLPRPDLATIHGNDPFGDNLGISNLTPTTIRNALAGQLGGAAVGGGLGYMQGGTDEERRRNALTGAAGGALLGGSGGMAAERIGQTAGGQFAKNLVGDAVQAQRDAMGRTSQGIASLSKMANIWKVSTTSTLRNLLQDEGTARLWASNEGIRQGAINDNWRSLVDLYNRGVRDGFDALPQDTQDFLDKWGKNGYLPQIGDNFTTENKKLMDQFSAVDTAKGEALLSIANPAASGIPVLGTALAGVKGYTRAFQQSLFDRINEFTRVASRHAAFQDETDAAMTVASHDFLSQLQGQGWNTSVLDPAKGFTPADVAHDISLQAVAQGKSPQIAKLNGEAAARAWDSHVNEVIKLGEERAKDIFGDFSKQTGIEHAVSSVVPFASWAIKAYPRTLKLMADHPGVSLAVMTLLQQQNDESKRTGTPGYLTGTIPISDKVPVVGALVRALNGGQSGEGRLNLLSAISPIGGQLIGDDNSQPDDNAYQKAESLLGRTGFSFNPLIQAMAYATNKDYRQPGALSRTANVETILPGSELPSVAQGPLNLVRKLAGGTPQTADPLDRKIGEVYFNQTGHNLADASNVSDPQRAALLAQANDPNSPLVQEAKAQLSISNPTKQALSLALPVQLTGRDDTAIAAGKAKAEVANRPAANYDPAVIRQLEAQDKGGSGGIAAAIDAYLMDQGNRGTQADLPAIAKINQQVSDEDRASLLQRLLAYQGGLYYQGQGYQQTPLDRLLAGR